MDIMSKAQRAACENCIKRCEQLRITCQKMVASSSERGTLASHEQCYDACRLCITACYECIKHMQDYLKTCVLDTHITRVKECIKQCENCIKVSEDCIRICEASEPAIPEVNSGHGTSCVQACLSCIQACEACIQACQECLVGQPPIKTEPVC